MKNFKILAGNVGSGKSRTLLSKIKKLGEQGKKVFAVNLEYNQEDLVHVKDVDLNLFDSIESMLSYVSKEKINTEQIVLVVDNGSININSSNIAALKKLKFNQTIITVQTNRIAQLNEESKDAISGTIFSQWGIEESEIDVNFITNPPKMI